MTFTEAAAEVLRLVGKPLHYKEITDLAIEKNLLSHVGKSPDVTMGARLAATLKKDSADNPLVRVKPGVFALREWSDKTIKAGLEPRKGGRRGQRAEPEAESAPAGDGDGALSAAHAGADDDDEVLIGAGAEEEEEPAVELAADEEAPVEAARSHAAPAHDSSRPQPADAAVEQAS